MVCPNARVIFDCCSGESLESEGCLSPTNSLPMTFSASCLRHSELLRFWWLHWFIRSIIDSSNESEKDLFSMISTSHFMAYLQMAETNCISSDGWIDGLPLLRHFLIRLLKIGILFWFLRTISTNLASRHLTATAQNWLCSVFSWKSIRSMQKSSERLAIQYLSSSSSNWEPRKQSL